LLKIGATRGKLKTENQKSKIENVLLFPDKFAVKVISLPAQPGWK
jgi:hypothetical protein